MWQSGEVKKGEELAVFVYGTLMPGGRAWAERCEGRVVGMRRARVRGRLFDLRLAGYPAVAWEMQNVECRMQNSKCKSGEGAEREAEVRERGLKHRATAGWVRGWRLALRDAGVLRGLDAGEGYVEGRARSTDSTSSPQASSGRAYSENEYERVRVECFAEENSNDEIRITKEAGKNKKRGKKGSARLGGAWVYVMRAERIAELGGVEVPGGEWTG